MDASSDSEELYGAAGEAASDKGRGNESVHRVCLLQTACARVADCRAGRHVSEEKRKEKKKGREIQIEEKEMLGKQKKGREESTEDTEGKTSECKREERQKRDVVTKEGRG